jgi:hypothetical protein
MFNERSPNISPYPQRSPHYVSSTQNLHTATRPTPEPFAQNGSNKSYLLQKVQALLPYLSEILSQNDVRTSGIVGKLSHLR